MALKFKLEAINVSVLTCAQLQAASSAGDQAIEDLYLKTRTDPTDPSTGAPRLTHYALEHPDTIDQTNPLWMDVYRAQLLWRTVRSLIIKRQRTLGCFQRI